jgi:hypothetical protein
MCYENEIETDRHQCCQSKKKQRVWMSTVKVEETIALTESEKRRITGLWENFWNSLSSFFFLCDLEEYHLESVVMLFSNVDWKKEKERGLLPFPVILYTVRVIIDICCKCSCLWIWSQAFQSTKTLLEMKGSSLKWFFTHDPMNTNRHHDSPAALHIQLKSMSSYRVTFSPIDG